MRVITNMPKNPGKMVLDATHIEFLNSYSNNLNDSLQRFPKVNAKFTQVIVFVVLDQ